MLQRFAFTTAALLLSTAAARAQLPSGSWQLKFADEFNATSLDTVKWSTAYPWGRTHNYPAYIRDENITVSGGTLNLQAKRESYNGQPFTSGAINSNGKFNFKQGYIEARMKLPSFLGAWPAFWALQDGWPPELDVMEARFRSDYDAATNSYPGYGDMYQYIGTYHWGADYTQEHSAGTGFKYTGQNLTDNFHNYGTAWESDHVTFYFDGQDMGSVWSSTANIAQMQNMYLLLNLGVGGWPGDPPGWADLSPQFQIDWVRVWQHPGQTRSNYQSAGNGNINWETASWSAGAPGLGAQEAFFGNQAAGTTDVHLDWTASKTLGAISFQSTTNFNIGWPDDSLMLADTAGRAYINAYANTPGNGAMAVSSRLELYNNTSIRNYTTTPINLNGAVIGWGELAIENGKTILNSLASYTGATVVKNAGDLTINGVISATSNLFINSGKATIAPNGSVTTAAYTSIGVTSGDVATLTLQSGARLTVNGDLNISDLTGSNGTLNLAAAAVKAQTLYVGKSGNSKGVVLQAAGSVSTLPGGNDWRIGGAFSSADAASVGTYTLTGGSLSVANNFQVGAYGNGTFTQSAGAVTASAYLSIGRFAGGVGKYDLSTGNGTLTANTTPYLIVGEQGAGTLLVGASATVNALALSLGHNGGTGTVTQTGGTVTAPGGVVFGLNAAGGSGTYNLNGGTLLTSAFTKGPGAGTLNFAGGTLKPTASTTTFLQGLTSANFKPGGLTIDTAGFNITIQQNLLTAGGQTPGGLTKTGPGTLTLTGQNTYTGPTQLSQGALIINNTVNSAITISSAALLGGSGNLTAGLDSYGEVAPQASTANSPGTLKSTTARFRPTAKLTTDLASPTSYDRLALTSAVTIDPGAALNITLPNNYLPTGGETFDILTFASRTGQFTSYTGTILSSGLALAPIYTPTTLRLFATSPGDTNADGTVNFADFQQLERNFGKTTAQWTDGDFNFDGTVDTADFRLLKSHFGQSLPAPTSPIEGPTNVPEPTGILLLVPAALILQTRRREP